MDNKEEIKKRLTELGYTKIVEYDDPANEFFAEHDHEMDQVIVILKGSMKVVMSGKEHELRAGDELLFPAKIMHSAKVGPEGCFYIDGEKT